MIYLIAVIFIMSSLGVAVAFAEQRARGCEIISVKKVAVGERGSY